MMKMTSSTSMTSISGVMLMDEYELPLSTAAATCTSEAGRRPCGPRSSEAQQHGEARNDRHGQRGDQHERDGTPGQEILLLRAIDRRGRRDGRSDRRRRLAQDHDGRTTAPEREVQPRHRSALLERISQPFFPKSLRQRLRKPPCRALDQTPCERLGPIKTLAIHRP